ncbi:MAG: QueT transporter family protein [Coriobacteriaceae bacterium]|nr:QueT transporter family protein [Coriobacteriaceae bacterium]
MDKPTSYVARAGMIAAAYASLTVISLLFLQGLAWGPIQLRVSEALTVLAVLTPAAIPGLTIGCLLANLLGIALTGSGVMGLFDVVFGSLATLLAALWCHRFKERPVLALAGPVIANALIVAAYLPIILAAYGFYTIPFTDIDLAGSYPLMYLFGALSISIGEAVVVYGLGYPLMLALRKLPLFQHHED